MRAEDASCEQRGLANVQGTLRRGPRATGSKEAEVGGPASEAIASERDSFDVFDLFDCCDPAWLATNDLVQPLARSDADIRATKRQRLRLEHVRDAKRCGSSVTLAWRSTHRLRMSSDRHRSRVKDALNALRQVMGILGTRATETVRANSRLPLLHRHIAVAPGCTGNGNCSRWQTTADTSNVSCHAFAPTANA